MAFSGREHGVCLVDRESDQKLRVRADGVLLTCEPGARAAVAQRYFLF